jgi:hypothetical protein
MFTIIKLRIKNGTTMNSRMQAYGPFDSFNQAQKALDEITDALNRRPQHYDVYTERGFADVLCIGCKLALQYTITNLDSAQYTPKY